MAQLRGEGAMTGVNLVARHYFNNVTPDGKTSYLDVQVDARDRRGPGQTNLHLITTQVTNPETGKTQYNNGGRYSTSQFETIKAAAGPNVEPIMNKAGDKQIGAVYGVKADLMRNSGQGLIINTKKVGQSEFKVDANTLENQFASMSAAKAANAEAQAQAQPEAEAEAQATSEQAAAFEPQVG